MDEIRLPSTRSLAFSAYQTQSSAIQEIKRGIIEHIGKKPDRVKILFMIDELDRCRPDYAITYLETIKHIFSIKGTAFVLANAMYELIGCGGLGYREAYDFLVKLFSGTDDERAYWWFRILFSGGALKVRYVEDMNNEFVQELLNTEGGREMFDSLSIKVNFTFPKIYKQIESFSPHKWSISMG